MHQNVDSETMKFPISFNSFLYLSSFADEKYKHIMKVLSYHTNYVNMPYYIHEELLNFQNNAIEHLKLLCLWELTYNSLHFDATQTCTHFQ